MGYARSYSTDTKTGFDYMTQLTTGENELIVGGGFGSVGDQIILKQIGDADDSGWDKTIAAHLSGAMPVYFKEANWGRRSRPSKMMKA